MGQALVIAVVVFGSILLSTFVIERARNWAVLQTNNSFAAFIMDSTAGANYGIAVLVVVIILFLLGLLVLSKRSG